MMRTLRTGIELPGLERRLVGCSIRVPRPGHHMSSLPVALFELFIQPLRAGYVVLALGISHFQRGASLNQVRPDT